MNLSPSHVLSAVSILLAIVGMIFPNNIVIASGVLLLGVANFVP